MTCATLSHHELEPDDPSPDYEPLRSGIVRRVDRLADGVELNLRPAIDVPVDPHRPRAHAHLEQIGSTRVRQLRFSVQRAAKTEPLQPGGDFDCAGAAAEERSPRLDSLELRLT